MLYVHRMMGDGAPGEVDPSAGGPAVRATYARIAARRRALRGPLPDRAQACRDSCRCGARPRSRCACSPHPGASCPTRRSRSTRSGATRPADEDRHGRRRRRQAVVRPRRRQGRRPRARPPAGSSPRRGRRSTSRRARRRRATASAWPCPRRRRSAATASADVRPAQLTVTTTATPPALLAGQQNRDSVTIGGAYGGWRGTVEVRLYGPFRSQAAISCAGAPLATTQLRDRRRAVDDAAARAGRARVVRLPADDREHRRRHRPHDAVRRAGRDVQGRGAAGRGHAGQLADHACRQRGHRHGRR